MSTRIFKATVCLVLLTTAALAQQDERADGARRHENSKTRAFTKTINSITAKAEKLATTVATRFEEDFGPFDGDWPSAKTVNIPAADEGVTAQENTTQAGDDARKTKRYVKVYAVKAGDKLQVDNQYGKVIVNTWDKNEFKVDVEIKAFAPNDQKADDLLESVNITDSKSDGTVSFKTNFSSGGKWWDSNLWVSNKGNRGVQVNYTIFMPAKNPLAVNNRYGTTEIADFDGPVSLRSSYGRLKTGNLSNSSCSVNTSYGSADIVAFSGGNINSSYGSLSLGTASNLDADLKYGSAKIGSLKGDVKFRMSYMGGVRIGNLGSGLKSLDIDADYSGINIGTEESPGFNFDVTVKYSGFNYDQGRVANLIVNPDDTGRGFNPTKNYKGRFGKGGARVRINSSYTSVKFN